MIVESPVPVPNKRNTLGIFQFPWGELSDQPVYQPAFNPALLAGPMLNAKLKARSRQVEPEPTEYSSSFFDDYDEYLDENEDAESDDDFDETTLWEIASLLKSKDVPSKDSLLPPAREVIEDYDDDTDFESDSEEVSPSNDSAIELTAKEESQLWVTGLTTASTAVTTGLPQPEPLTWEALVPAVDDIVWSKPRASENLPVLATLELRVSPSGLKVSPTGPSPWSGKAIAVELESPSTSPAVTLSPLMWVPEPTQTDAHHSGLFSVDAPYTDFRTKEACPVVQTIIRVPQPSAKGIPTVSSRSLWSPNQNLIEPAEWISKSKANGHAPSVAPKSSMWTPTIEVAAVAFFGLFNVSTPRSDYRKSNLSPAALNMVCKPRAVQAPLSQLKSKNLWSGLGEQSIEHHWISESSIRPNSPFIYSTTSSGRSSPASDASSVVSTSTKASSLWSSIGSAALTAVPAWWDQKGSKKSTPANNTQRPKTPVDDAKHASKIPAPQPSTKALAPVRESRVLASRDLWEEKALVLEATPTRKLCRSTVSQLPAHRPLRHQYRPVIAFRASWDEALAEAIAAGSPQKSRTRPVATKADWDNTFAKTISQSEPHLQRPVYSSNLWTAALAVAVASGKAPMAQSKPPLLASDFSSKVSEAVLAETIENVSIHIFDPAALHPVFFTESLVSIVEDIHAAAIGHVVRPIDEPVQVAQIWSASSSAETSPIITVGSMWSRETAPKREAPEQFAELNDKIVRKASLAKTLDPPQIESTSFWQPSQAVTSERNWLSAAKKCSSAMTWAPRAVSPVQRIYKTVASPSSPDIFAHVKGENIKKAAPRPAALPHLSSSEHFGSGSNSQPASPHWLHETSSMATAPKASTPAPKPLARSQTWTPPATGVSRSLESNSMWESRTEMQILPPTLFSNPHVEPWDRKKRYSIAVKDIESKETWRPSREMPESPKNWLIKRFSRVEFRY
jgi:hypothetical protein